MKHKKLISFLKIIAVFLVLTCLSGCSNLNIKDWAVKKQAINYLCEKYDAEPDEFELVDYNPDHIYWQEYEIFFLKPVEIDYSFEFIYNDRHFVVNRDKIGFYDDYQFEDIELWGTEWLQENVNKSIVGFYLETDGILEYYKSTIKRYDYVLTKEDAEDFLKNHQSDNYPEIIYYSDATLNEYSMNISPSLAHEIEKALQFDKPCNAGYRDKIPFRTIDKSKNWIWYSYLCFEK